MKNPNSRVQDVQIVAPIIPFKTAYGDHDRQSFSTTGASLTHQSMAAETDINNIMRKFEKTGILEHRNTFEGKYGDFTDIPMDYHESMNAVLAANDMFTTLPAKIRRRFGNDPSQFLDFVGDPSNSEEMIRLGLAKAPQSSVIDDTPPKVPSDQKEPNGSPTPPKSSQISGKSSDK